MLQSMRSVNEMVGLGSVYGFGKHGVGTISESADHLLGSNLADSTQAACILTSELITMPVEAAAGAVMAQGPTAKGGFTFGFLQPGCHGTTSSLPRSKSNEVAEYLLRAASPYPYHSYSREDVNDSCAPVKGHGASDINASGRSKMAVQSHEHATASRASASLAFTSAPDAGAAQVPVNICASSLTTASTMLTKPPDSALFLSSCLASLSRVQPMLAHASAPDNAPLRQQQSNLLEQQQQRPVAPAVQQGKRHNGKDPRFDQWPATACPGQPCTGMTPAERAKHALMLHSTRFSSNSGDARSSGGTSWSSCLRAQRTVEGPTAAVIGPTAVLPPLRPEGPFDWALELTKDDPAADARSGGWGAAGMSFFEEQMASMNQAAWTTQTARQIATPAASLGPLLSGTLGMGLGQGPAGGEAALQSRAARMQPEPKRTALVLTRSEAPAPAQPLAPLSTPAPRAQPRGNAAAGLRHAPTAAAATGSVAAAAVANRVGAAASGDPAGCSGLRSAPWTAPLSQPLESLSHLHPSHQQPQEPTPTAPCTHDGLRPQALEPPLGEALPLGQQGQAREMLQRPKPDSPSQPGPMPIPRQMQQQQRQAPPPQRLSPPTCASLGAGNPTDMDVASGGNGDNSGGGGTNSSCSGGGDGSAQVSLLATVARLAAGGFKSVPGGAFWPHGGNPACPVPSRAKRSSADAALPDMCQSMLRREAIISSMERLLMLGSPLETPEPGNRGTGTRSGHSLGM